MLLFVRGLTVLNITLTIGIFLGVTLFTFLLLKESRKSYANIFLGLIILLYTIFLTPGFLEASRLLEHVPHFSNIGSFLFPMLGPLIYFYTKANTEQNFRLRKQDAIHILPFFIFLLVDWHLLTMSGTEKYAAFQVLIHDGAYPYPFWELLIKLSIMIGYYIASIRIILQYKQYQEDTSSQIDRIHYQWLLLFSTTLLVPLLVSTLVVLSQYQLVSVRVYAFSFVFFNMMVYFAILYKPSLFQRFPNRMEPASVREEAKKKYERSSLRNSQKEKLVTQLLDYVEAEKPYLEPELTLGQLSKQVDIPVHYLSQIINEKMEKSFGDFINGYRIEKAKELLTDEAFSHLTIIAIAYNAGFNSKTAFYDAFKKFTGTTPSKYRKALELS